MFFVGFRASLKKRVFVVGFSAFFVRQIRCEKIAFIYIEGAVDKSISEKRSCNKEIKMATNVQRNNQKNNNNDEVRFDLMEHIGVLGTKENGWTKEVNIVAWNGGAAKVDVRDWDPDHERMSRGITLYEEEAEKLAKALAARYGVGICDKEKGGEVS